jgi:hypothetical protein
MPPSLRKGTTELVPMISIGSRAEMRQQEIFFSASAPEAARGFTSPRAHVQSKPRMSPGFSDPLPVPMKPVHPLPTGEGWGFLFPTSWEGRTPSPLRGGRLVRVR